MNALVKALFEVLGKAKAVTDLLAAGSKSIFEDEAPENAAYPHIVISRVIGTARYSLPKREWEEFVMQVEAFTEGETSKPAQEIAEAVDATLSDGAFTIPGHDLMYSRKLTDMPSLPEREGGIRYNRRGAHFEIWVGPEA